MKLYAQICMLSVCLLLIAVAGESAEQVHMVWQPVHEGANDLTAREKISGINVISPSFFEISGENGWVKDFVDESYVKGLKEKGYQVWPLITNSFDPDLTHQILQNAAARTYVIDQIVFFIERYDLDGINLDFENIYDEDKEALTAFVAEISAAVHAENKMVSVDVTVPSDTANWSPCYDRKNLAQVTDYIVLMAYDEHWRSSKTAGSVASLGWVARGIQSLLTDISPDKIILGVPFYTRLWQESNGEVVRASTVTMPQTDQLWKEKGIERRWLPDMGQYYFEYQEDGQRFRVWQEDTRSLQEKNSLVQKYKLAGIAAWRKGFEESSVWQVFAP